MIYSIGYQRIKPKRIADLMECLDITLLIDVRKRPFSHINGYSAGALQETFGDKYVAKGKTLGGSGNTTPEGIEWLKQYDGKDKPNVMLMCMEDFPTECHRYHAICAPHFPDSIHYHEGKLVTTKAITEALAMKQDECEILCEVEFDD